MSLILALVCTLFVFQTITAKSVHACDLEGLARTGVASVEANDHSDTAKDQAKGHHCVCNCAHQPAFLTGTLSVTSIVPSVKKVNIYDLPANLSSSSKGLFKPPRA